MSEEFVSGCIQHRDTRHLRLYYDYMDIYSDNEYKAKIIRILETWTDHKRAEWYKTNSDRLEQGQEFLEPDFWITMSYQQFRYYMRHTASEDTLKKALVELEQAKHIKRRVNPDFPYGPPQYLLNSKVIQAALNKLTTPPLVPDLPPQEDTPPPGKNIPPQEITPTQGVELPPPRGENTREGGRKITPTQGGKIGTSNITTKNYLEDVIDSNKEESEGEQSDTTTSAPSLPLDAASSSSPQSDTHAHCFFCQEEAELTCRVCGKGVCYDTHGRRFPLTETDIEDYCLTCLDAHNAAILSQIRIAASTTTPAPSEAGTDSTRLQESEKGHTDATATDLPSRDDHRDSLAVTHSAHDDALDRAGQLDPEIDEEWCNAETEHRLPAIPKTAPPLGPSSHEQNRDASPRNVAVESDLGVASSAPIPPVPSEVSPPRTMRATVVSPDGPQLSVVPQKGRRGKNVEQDKPAAVPKCDTREIQRRINTHRGYALEEDVDIIRERKAIKTWCNLHTLEDYEEVMKRLSQDPYWKKPENYYRIGGLTLLKETARVLGEKARQNVTPANPHGTVSGLPRLEIDPEWLEAMGGR